MLHTLYMDCFTSFSQYSKEAELLSHPFLNMGAKAKGNDLTIQSLVESGFGLLKMHLHHVFELKERQTIQSQARVLHGNSEEQQY